MRVKLERITRRRINHHSIRSGVILSLLPLPLLLLLLLQLRESLECGLRLSITVLFSLKRKLPQALGMNDVEKRGLDAVALPAL